MKDDQFGYVLHVVDLAINKVMAAASRREPRDIVDLLTLHDRVLPLGALVWAAVETAPGYTPEGLIGEIRRTARYPAEELRQLAADPPIDPAAIMTRLRTALDDAEKFVAAMPSDKAGLIFLRAGRPVRARSDAARRPHRAFGAPPRTLAVEPGHHGRHAGASAGAETVTALRVASCILRGGHTLMGPIMMVGWSTGLVALAYRRMSFLSRGGPQDRIRQQKCRGLDLATENWALQLRWSRYGQAIWTSWHWCWGRTRPWRTTGMAACCILGAVSVSYRLERKVSRGINYSLETIASHSASHICMI